VYFDSAYIAKYYVHEPESLAIRALVNAAPMVYSSSWALAEVQCAFHRKMREGSAMARGILELSQAFLDHVNEGFWDFVPVKDSLLRRAGSLVLSSPPGIFLRAGDAVHLTTARDLGEKEVWTGDRHMLAAAPRFGLIGRSVSQIS
jgi:predicted nucleic acid-binding protein